MNGIHCNPATVSLVENGNTLDSDKAKADAFARRFAETSGNGNYTTVFQEHKKDIEENHRELFTNNAPETEISRTMNVEFTLHELNFALGQVRKSTTPGEDRIMYEMLTKLPESSKEVLLRLFNNIWRTENVPKTWKHAIVIPILKVGKDPRNAASYRPISLTSTMCKTMERLVANRLRWYMEKNGLLSKVQSGFRRNRSTIDQIARLHETIVRRFNTSGHVLAVFLDMEKAFDMVWKKGLMIKLKRFGINGRMFQWLDSFMNERTIQVRVGSTLSETVILENGTPQGSMISPDEFILMIDDLPSSVKVADTSLFADDGMLFVEGHSVASVNSTVRKMQEALDDVHQWCDEWGFKLSTEKSVAVMFSLKTTPPVKLTIDNTEISIQKSAKFLGVIFDHQLRWTEHIK